MKTDQKFERHPTWIKNKATGAEFHYRTIPPEFSPDDGWYENPQYNLRVGFHIGLIYERKALDRNGRVVAWPLCTGVILVKGELRYLLVNATVEHEPSSRIDHFIRDCYELIIEWLKGQHEFGRFNITPHIYETESRRFIDLTITPEVRPEAIHEPDVELVV
jgi:hypothetical protein